MDSFLGKCSALFLGFALGASPRITSQSASQVAFVTPTCQGLRKTPFKL